MGMWERRRNGQTHGDDRKALDGRGVVLFPYVDELEGTPSGEPHPYPAEDSALSGGQPREDWDSARLDERRLAPAARGAALSAGTQEPDVPARYGDEEPPAPVVISGTGISMGTPFIKRRPRPLTMRLALFALIAVILVTGLFTVTPLAVGAQGNMTTFQAISGGVIVHSGVSFHWYVAQPGDVVESVAAKFHVQIGGIYELNGMTAGQELQIGHPYKIPDDPYYGANYRAPQPAYLAGGDGTTTFGSDWWNSYAGNPLDGAPCAPNGGGNPLGYQLQSPNWGSVWKRGFSWYHNGVDIAAPAGNPIHAAQYGQVIFSGWTNTGFGFAVRINHCNHLSTLYGHMAKLLVKAGDFVVPGTVIGLEGSTGWSSGPHLHFSVLIENTFVDPMPYYGDSITAITQGG